MRSLGYLNGVLTVLAVLLVLNLWVGWHALSTGPAGDMVTVATPARAQGIPDGGAQRLEIVNQLKLVNVRLAELGEFMRSGEMRVRFEGRQPGPGQTPNPLMSAPPRPRTQLPQGEAEGE
ncbi:MAG: hypothetical protein WD009_12150 [Phycisphaeraceae bacterium]